MSRVSFLIFGTNPFIGTNDLARLIPPTLQKKAEFSLQAEIDCRVARAVGAILAVASGVCLVRSRSTSLVVCLISSLALGLLGHIRLPQAIQMTLLDEKEIEIYTEKFQRYLEENDQEFLSRFFSKLNPCDHPDLITSLERSLQHDYFNELKSARGILKLFKEMIEKARGNNERLTEEERQPIVTFLNEKASEIIVLEKILPYLCRQFFKPLDENTTHIKSNFFKQYHQLSPSWCSTIPKKLMFLP